MRWVISVDTISFLHKEVKMFSRRNLWRKNSDAKMMRQIFGDLWWAVSTVHFVTDERSLLYTRWWVRFAFWYAKKRKIDVQAILMMRPDNHPLAEMAKRGWLKLWYIEPSKRQPMKDTLKARLQPLLPTRHKWCKIDDIEFRRVDVTTIIHYLPNDESWWYRQIGSNREVADLAAQIFETVKRGAIPYIP
jgi:hypothetical protein